MNKKNDGEGKSGEKVSMTCIVCEGSGSCEVPGCDNGVVLIDPDDPVYKESEMLETVQIADGYSKDLADELLGTGAEIDEGDDPHNHHFSEN